MLFTGSLLLGIGFGLLVHEAAAGTLIGLGVGFILEGLMARTLWRRDRV